MEIIALWFFLALGVFLLILSLRKPPRKDLLLLFFTAAYLGSFLGMVVIEAQLITYPVKLLQSFPQNVLFEALLLPTICIYYYQTSYQSNMIGSIWQALVYSGFLASAEFFLEKYTSLIKYLQWEWYYSWISVLIFLVLVRFLMKLINKEASQDRSV